MATRKQQLCGSPRHLFPMDADTDTLTFERRAIRQGYSLVAGVDEVGRGPLAGPVVAASVILPDGCDCSRFDDSKKLSAKVREARCQELTEIGALVGIGIVGEADIDKINILQASLLAMKKSLEALPVTADFLLVDGRHQVPIAIPQETLVKGDSRSASIAAASIIAKVTRDRMMADYHQKFPLYNFQKHKGYPTAEHRKALAEHGPCPIHRRSFAGVKEFFKEKP